MPEYQYFVLALKRLERQLTHNAVGFFDGNDTLLVFAGTRKAQPVAERLVGVVENKLPPAGKQHGEFVFGRQQGENQVDVGVYEPVHFEARATAAASVVGLSVFAIEVRSQGKCQG